MSVLAIELEIAHARVTHLHGHNMQHFPDVAWKDRYHVSCSFGMQTSRLPSSTNPENAASYSGCDWQHRRSFARMSNTTLDASRLNDLSCFYRSDI